jgi:hypothetical protein
MEARVGIVSNTIRSLPDLTRHLPAYCSVIEEIVEGFVEGFSILISFKFLVEICDLGVEIADVSHPPVVVA